MKRGIVRIGGASGFWGDSNDAALQVAEAGVDYIILDYLAEVTMAILARAKAKNPVLGYATDFVDPVMSSLFARSGKPMPRIVTNAGGMNPKACRDALMSVAGKLGLSPNIAVVEGDDLVRSANAFAAGGLREIDTGAAFPESPWSVNAYIGALPIARAIAAGADIVITGRCADSALVLGPLMAEFGWGADAYDLLAAGSLAGHVIECGCQATGGNFTDWRDVDGWDNMGFPIIEVSSDGSFVLTKPDGTGGLVTPLSAGEQVIYEIGDPARYILPDVICDFTDVKLEQVGSDRVRVSGARGKAPTSSYKTSATFQDGFRCTAMFTLCGRDAAAKAHRVAESIIARTRRQFANASLGDYRRVSIKLLGTEHQYGANANPSLSASREVVLRLDVHHDSRQALEMFSREIAPAGLAMAPGRCGLFGGRPNVSPIIGHRAFLVPKSDVPILVSLGDTIEMVQIPVGCDEPAAKAGAPSPTVGTPPSGRTVPLFSLACARSGDKGDSVNIGVIARSPEYIDLLKRELSAARVKEYFGDLVLGTVERFELQGMGALNFLLRRALDGGGTSSLRNDPQGKTFAQMLLDIEVAVPETLGTGQA